MPQEQVLTNEETQAPLGLSTEEFDRLNEEAATETVQVEQTEQAGEAAPVVDEESDTARDRGWVDEERWTGKGKWVDAKTFNRIYETRTVPKKLQSENAELRRQMDELRVEVAESRKWREEQAATREQIRLDTLKSERARAYEEQDFKRVVELDDELLDLRVKAATPKPQPAQAPNEWARASKVALDNFTAENPIFTQDEELGDVLTEQVAIIQAMANQKAILAKQNGQAIKYVSPEALLERAKDRVQRMYPEKFRPAKRAAMAETGGTPGGNRVNGHTWADLKPETQRTLDDFIRLNKGLTREAVLKSCSADDFRK